MNRGVNKMSRGGAGKWTRGGGGAAQASPTTPLQPTGFDDASVRDTHHRMHAHDAAPTPDSEKTPASYNPTEGKDALSNLYCAENYESCEVGDATILPAQTAEEAHSLIMSKVKAME